MVKQDPFEIEQWMDLHDVDIEHNLGESCCDPITFKELQDLSGNKLNVDAIMNQKVGYGWIHGSPKLLNLVSQLYQNIQSDEIVLTNGSIGANFLAFYTLIEKDDHVICMDPIYQQLKSVPEAFGATVDRFTLNESNHWLPDLKELQSLIKPNTKMIILNNPNNPTGSVISDDILRDIVEIAKEKNIWVFCDEVYRPSFHSTNEVPPSIVELYEKGISCGSTSKAFAAAGLRLGWLVCKNKEFIKEANIRRDYNAISMSPITDLFAQFVLENKKVLLERNYNLCIENLKIIQGCIDESNGLLSWEKPKAGTTAFVKVNKNIDTLKMCAELARDDKVLIVPGDTFGYPRYLRVGIGSATRDIQPGFTKLINYLKRN
ncbi:hypothetical protein DAMA08_021920 [Martiniozyma asiatica (nom. inval.)]|nr:hypothetical protein DAMA08_021920 [Martiniozyma asiatica]